MSKQEHPQPFGWSSSLPPSCSTCSKWRLCSVTYMHSEREERHQAAPPLLAISQEGCGYLPPDTLLNWANLLIGILLAGRDIGRKRVRKFFCISSEPEIFLEDFMPHTLLYSGYLKKKQEQQKKLTNTLCNKYNQIQYSESTRGETIPQMQINMHSLAHFKFCEKGRKLIPEMWNYIYCDHQICCNQLMSVQSIPVHMFWQCGFRSSQKDRITENSYLGNKEQKEPILVSDRNFCSSRESLIRIFPMTHHKRWLEKTKWDAGAQYISLSLRSPVLLNLTG